MLDLKQSKLPPIPDKRYFTIGEASKLCGVQPHVLRYWEQEFPQLKPVTRRGNRRYYQQHDVGLIREIRELLYENGYTISGARQKLLNNKAAEKKEIAPIINDHAIIIENICAELESLANTLARATR
ncbi:MAG: MerR family transcriptional regulator [Gammaproteobacteria bacterium]|nr:MerR family transcriptional regulator [Gammaproteobacteria bacterium]